MALIYLQDTEDYILGIWRVQETLEELIHISGVGHDLLEKYKNPKRKTEIAAVRALLRTLTGEIKTIAYNDDGSPYLIDNSYQISISHTVGYVAIILSKLRKIGIDIEKYSDTVLRVKDKFVSEEENSILQLNSEKIKEALIICWSAKETMFKMIPTDEIDFCDHLRLTPFIISSNCDEIKAQEFKTSNMEEWNLL